MNEKRTVLLYVITWIAGLLFTLLKGWWMQGLGCNMLDLDLIVILTAYLYLRRGGVAAGCFAFGQGLVMDTFSGGFEGLFVFLYLISLACIALLSRFLQLNNPRGQVFVVGATWLVEKVLFGVMLLALGSRVVLEGRDVWFLVLSLVISAMVAPVCFSLLDRMKAAVSDPTHEGNILEQH